MALEPQSDLPALIVELIRDPVVIVTSGDAGRGTPTISYANSGFTRLIRRSEDTMIGQSLDALVSAVAEPLGLARLIDAIERHRGIDLTLQIVAEGSRILWTRSRVDRSRASTGATWSNCAT